MSEPYPGIVLPRNEREELVAACWRDVLGLEDPSVEDDFFELGGDSVQAAQLTILLSSKLDVAVPETLIFECRTIEALAAALERSHGPSVIVPLQPMGDATPFFCIHSHNGRADFAQLARCMGKERPIFGIQNRTVWLDGGGYARAQDMVRHYTDEIRRVQVTGPYLLGGYCFGGVVALAIALELQRQGDEVAFVGVIEPGPRSGKVTCRLAFLAYCLRQTITCGSRRHATMVLETALRICGGSLKPARKRQDDEVASGIDPRICNLGLAIEVRDEAYQGPVGVFCSGFRAFASPDAFRWRALAGERVEFVRFRDFKSCMTEPGVGAFAAALRSALERAEAEHAEISARACRAAAEASAAD